MSKNVFGTEGSAKFMSFENEKCNIEAFHADYILFDG
jgi:hypothetical protein